MAEFKGQLDAKDYPRTVKNALDGIVGKVGAPTKMKGEPKDIPSLSQNKFMKKGA